MNVVELDHLVLTVSNIEKTIDFYQCALSMEAITYGEGRRALKFGTQKINLHPVSDEIEPKASIAQPGTADMCFITHKPINQVISGLLQRNVKIIEGPVERTGATCQLISIYIRDPDHNLIEISNRIENEA